MDAHHKDRVVHHLEQPSTDQEYACQLLSCPDYSQGLAFVLVVLILCKQSVNSALQIRSFL